MCTRNLSRSTSSTTHRNLKACTTRRCDERGIGRGWHCVDSYLLNCIAGARCPIFPAYVCGRPGLPACSLCAGSNDTGTWLFGSSCSSFNFDDIRDGNTFLFLTCWCFPKQSELVKCASTPCHQEKTSLHQKGGKS